MQKTTEVMQTSSYAMKANKISPLLTGTKIPDVSVRTIDNQRVRLIKLVNKKPTILIFYRGGWCPYCNRQMGELHKIEEKLTRMGYQILAVGADKPELLQQSINKHNLSYTLLSDASMDAGKAFGLAFKVDDKTYMRYKKNGLDLETRSGYDHHLLPVPAVFLLDTNGFIQFEYVNPDYTIRLNPVVLVAAAKAYYPES